MLEKKTADTMILFSYFCVILLHIIYSIVNFDLATNIYSFLLIITGSIIIFISEHCINSSNTLVFKYGIQIFMMVFISCTLGYNLKLIAYTPIIYSMICLEFSAYSNVKINLICAFLCNIGILIPYTLTLDMIRNTIGRQCFLMLCAYFEITLLFEFFVVAFSTRRINESKLQTENLIKAQKSKDDFLANMSHEIRTPLNVVIGMCELLLREDDLSLEMRDYSDNIKSAGQNLLSIVNDILDFSKIGSGKMTLVEEPYSISTIISDIINMAKSRNAGKHLELIIDCNPNIPSVLYGDEQRIRQIFTNLVTNAIKYTHSGSIYIYVDSHVTHYGTNLHITVEDTGIGIKEENIDTIFGAFNQVDMKKNRRIEGTGLGLPISKQMTETMGGFIHAKSEYGVGSEFFVTIPQKIIDHTPFLTLKITQKPQILACITAEDDTTANVRNFYKKMINHLCNELPVNCYLCFDLSGLYATVKLKHITHIIVGSLYRKYPAHFIKLAKEYNVILIHDTSHKPPKLPGIIPLQKPVDTISLINAVNAESTLNISRSKTYFNTKLRMPDAHLLVVDDNIVNLKVIEGLLKPYQLTIDTVTSGQAAIDIVESKKYDLIFMDHMMPDMDGVEATRRIRIKDGDYFKELPIIAFSANALNGAREYFLSEGFQDFISKPVETSALERVLKTWIPSNLQQTNNT